ncbi:MAG TPA: hypothetical protein PLY34_18560 [Ferruginibacter sp.]|nr:hypothetical protein [Ferruginibacter sp.]HPH92844.1 hypothetical protein [Ferruginibacter sp.]
MKPFLNIVAVMLLTAWIAALLFDVGNTAHAILGLALLVVVLNVVWTGISAK